jgi:hypothetical protein
MISMKQMLLFIFLMITLTACNPFGEDPKIEGVRSIKDQDSQSIAIQIASQQMPEFLDHPGTKSEQINIGGKSPGKLISVIKKTEVSKIWENHYTVMFTLSWNNGENKHVTRYDVKTV